ncbi:tetratricopeptide repeat protein [bacterium]|nr:tetratricopeptide repeat protein [bacterium]
MKHHARLYCFCIVALSFGAARSLPAQSNEWLTLIHETFEENPIGRFHLNPVALPGKISTGGKSSWLKDQEAYRVSGYLSVLRPVQAGPHVDWRLSLTFVPATNDPAGFSRTKLMFVLFNRTVAGVALVSPSAHVAPNRVRFIQEFPDGRPTRILKDMPLDDRLPGGDWVLRYRHGLLTLLKGGRDLARADLQFLGVAVAGVVWQQEGGEAICREMVLRGERIVQDVEEYQKEHIAATRLTEEAKELLGKHQLEDALIKAREANKYWRLVCGEEHYVTANSQVNIAMILQRMGNHGAALEPLQDALKIHELTLGKQHPRTVQDRFQLGQCYLAEGETGKARKLWTECRDDWLAIYGPDYPFIRRLDILLLKRR